MTGSLIERVRERLAAENVALRPTEVAAVIRAESGGVLGDSDVLHGIKALHSELAGAGILEPLLCAEGTTDVLVTAHDRVWVDDGHGLRLTTVRFSDDAAVRRLAQRLALAVGRRLDDAQPFVDGQLTGIGPPDTVVRLHAVLAPIAVGGTCVSLRVLRPTTKGLDQLVADGTVPEEAAVILRGMLAARLAFLVTGGTGAGKTTLLSALLGAVDPTERIICAEDAAELAPRHPHVVTLAARTVNVEGVGEVTLRQLVRQALRMRPDRIVVGEVRGAEVVDLLTALNTGHDGGAGTVHANSPTEVPARLEALGALGGLDRAALHSQFAAAIQCVCHIRRFRDHRRLSEIALVRKGDDGIARVIPAWNLDGRPCAAVGELRALIAARSAS